MLPETFQTERLILRPIAPTDGDAIFEGYAQDAEVTRFLVWRPHRDRAETEAYIARCLATPTNEARTYVLTGRDDGRVRGALDLRWPASHRLEFGYVLARPWWGQGLMTEALTEVVRWALARPGIFRVGAWCDAENIGSARVMEKAGLIREGVARRWWRPPNIEGDPRDCYVYAITR